MSIEIILDYLFGISVFFLAPGQIEISIESSWGLFVADFIQDIVVLQGQFVFGNSLCSISFGQAKFC